ncbi:hypothetical protein HPB50_017824 [Hyalomma asiaticum]|uniref:Uncharacterized protein n=1 Tax=Hyalomma asiaticum TaxID=266040 RepID=A0ACB7SZW8_HYAAI|nr:hypothetical protein HPB50_017824 [Hyalomma asiaticum]
MPQDSLRCHTTIEAESNDSADKRITFDSGVGHCEATENVEDSSLQSVTVSACPDETTQNSSASVKPTSAITEQASLPALAVVETESEGNSRNSDLELSRANTVPDTPASDETSAAAAPSLDALLCEAFSSLTIGSDPYASLKEIRKSTNFMKGSEVEQIVIGAEARDTSAVVPDMSVAAGDTMQQSSDAGNHDLAPCADSARSSSCEEGSSSGASNCTLCPIITQPRKRTAAKRKAPTASTEELADGRPYSGPITRSRAARMAKQ